MKHILFSYDSLLLCILPTFIIRWGAVFLFTLVFQLLIMYVTTWCSNSCYLAFSPDWSSHGTWPARFWIARFMKLACWKIFLKFYFHYLAAFSCSPSTVFLCCWDELFCLQWFESCRTTNAALWAMVWSVVRWNCWLRYGATITRKRCIVPFAVACQSRPTSARCSRPR